MVQQMTKCNLSRRDFLRISLALGGAAAVASVLEGCAPTEPTPDAVLSPPNTPEVPTHTPTQIDLTHADPVPSPTPAEIVNQDTARLAFVRTKSRAEGVSKAIDLLGINPVEGKQVFLKPNFNSADPAPGSTHPEVLLALVTQLRDMGASKITVGDRSGMGNTRQVMEKLGIFRMAQEAGFDTVVFDELEPEDWVPIQPSASHWEQGYPFARPCLEADELVQTCCLKTHRYGGHFTLSLKNSVGMVAKQRSPGDHNFMQELHSSPYQRQMIAEINSAYNPALVVLDGVEAFIAGGPDRGELVSPEVIIAGTDRVAVDATGIAVLRLFGCKTETSQGTIFQQDQIARAVELGLGVDSPGKIEFLTGDEASAEYSQRVAQILLES